MWMAPEQTRSGAITPAVDVWALGLLAFHVLTGRYYWRAPESQDSTMTELLREIVIEPLRPASVRAEEAGVKHMLPPGFDAWFGRCVARDPASRFPNARDCFAALAQLLDGTPSQAAMTAPPAQTWAQPPPYSYGAYPAPWPAPAPYPYGPPPLGYPPPPKKGLGAGAIVAIVLGAVAVPIIGIVAFVVAIGNSAENARKRAMVHAELASLKMEAETWRVTSASKRCPTLSDLSTWRRNDPWGTPYQVTCSGSSITVTSAGPDKKMGTSDDQTSSTY